MAPRKKTTKQANTIPGVVIGGIMVLSLVITASLQSGTLLTGSSEAYGSRKCGETCRLNSRGSNCGAGFTCQAVPETGRLECMCNLGNCIQKKCVPSTGTATEGDECSTEYTTDAKRGKRVDVPSQACIDGLDCVNVVRAQGGSGYRCCDPKNPNPSDLCKSDPIPTVIPFPPGR